MRSYEAATFYMTWHSSTCTDSWPQRFYVHRCQVNIAPHDEEPQSLIASQQWGEQEEWEHSAIYPLRSSDTGSSLASIPVFQMLYSSLILPPSPLYFCFFTVCPPFTLSAFLILHSLFIFFSSWLFLGLTSILKWNQKLNAFSVNNSQSLADT